MHGEKEARGARRSCLNMEHGITHAHTFGPECIACIQCFLFFPASSFTRPFCLFSFVLPSVGGKDEEYETQVTAAPPAPSLVGVFRGSIEPRTPLRSDQIDTKK